MTPTPHFVLADPMDLNLYNFTQPTSPNMRLTSKIALALSLLTSIVTATPPQHPLAKPSAKSLLTLHRELIDIESISGNEHAVGKYLVHYLKTLGLTVETQVVVSSAQEVAPWKLYDDGSSAESVFKDSSSRFNIYAYSGKNRNPHTLLTTHIDTVPPYIPYSISSLHDTTSANRTISGRGSVDAKGSLAAMLTAYTSLTSSSTTPTLPSLGLLFVVDEEVGGKGMRDASDALNMTFPTVIFGEPTQGALACGHKGIFLFTVNVTGKAAHSGYPWLGVSANELLLQAMNGILKAELPSSEKYGASTVNIGRMEGGVAGNVIPQHALATVSVRLAGGTPEEAQKILKDAIAEATEHMLGKGGVVDVNWTHMGYGPVDFDCDVEGFEKITVNYGTDVPNLTGWKKGYLYGPGSILVAHSDHEALTVADLEKGVEDYKRIILATADL